MLGMDLGLIAARETLCQLSHVSSLAVLINMVSRFVFTRVNMPGLLVLNGTRATEESTTMKCCLRTALSPSKIISCDHEMKGSKLRHSTDNKEKTLRNTPNHTATFNEVQRRRDYEHWILAVRYFSRGNGRKKENV